VYTIFNNGSGTATNVQFALQLFDGLTLDSGFVAVSLGNMPVTTSRIVQVKLRANQNVIGFNRFDATITASNAQTKVVNRAVYVPVAFQQYLSQKQQLISDILGINRPLFGTSRPFYQATEIAAQHFVSDVSTAYQNGNADPLDMEGIARLTLSERVTKQSLIDAIDISLYGAKAFKGIIFAKILGLAFQHLADLVRVVPFVGGEAANALLDLASRIEQSLDLLNLAFVSGLKVPTGQLTSEQLAKAIEATNRGLDNAVAATADATIDAIDNHNINFGLFDLADHAIQDGLYLGVLEFQTRGEQQNALGHAMTHDFPNGTFSQAETDATRTLTEMTNQNQIAKDAGNFVDALSELVTVVNLILAAIVVLSGIIGAIATGGISLLASIAGVAGFLLTWGTYVSTALGPIEAGSAAIYVNGVLPYVYVNPSVNQAFGPRPTTPIVQQMVAKKEDVIHGSNRNGFLMQIEIAQAYYKRLRDMIASGNPSWATIGIDSLKYYENILDRSEDLASAQFLAAADSAAKVVGGYKTLAARFLAKAAARPLFTAGLEIGAFVYRSGLRNGAVLNTAITTLDSAISNNSKLDSLGSSIYEALQQHQIPIPSAIGVSNVEISILSKSSRTAKLRAEITNYGNAQITGVQVYPFLASAGSSVIGDSVKVVTLPGNGNAYAEFEVVARDSLLVGSIFTKPSTSASAYFILPSRSFFINFKTLSPDNQGSVGEGKTYGYPNPFNPDVENVKFRFKLAQDGNVTITVYDVSNTKVKEVISNVPMSARVEQSVTWNGRNESGTIVGNGVYFYVIESSSGERAVGKVAVLR